MTSARLTSIRAQLGPDWLSTFDAARACGTTSHDHFTRTIGPLLTHRSRSLKGKSARAVGYAYLRADCERVAELRKRLGITALRAAQLIYGIRQLKRLGLLDGIESQQNLDLDDDSTRRRFQ